MRGTQPCCIFPLISSMPLKSGTGLNSPDPSLSIPITLKFTHLHPMISSLGCKPALLVLILLGLNASHRLASCVSLLLNQPRLLLLMPLLLALMCMITQSFFGSPLLKQPLALVHLISNLVSLASTSQSLKMLNSPSHLDPHLLSRPHPSMD